MKHTVKAAVSLLLTAALACSAAGCSRSGNAAEQTAEAHSVSGKQISAEFREAQLTFTLDLLRRTLGSEEQPVNTLISPYSVMQALGMTANGASGNTKAQMEQVLCGGSPLDDLNGRLYQWRSNQPQTDGCRLKTANSIWFRDTEGFALLPEFLQTNADYYAAPAYTAPFDESTVSEINKWVRQHTDKMIPAIIERLNPDDMAVLVNAVAFDAKWAVRYEKDRIKNGWFTDFSGKQIPTEMMHSAEQYYLECADAVGFIRPYQGCYDFIAILPEAGTEPEEWLSNQTAASLTELLGSRQTTQVEAAVPPFSYSYQTEMQGLLAEMGMPDAFSGAADFSAMSNTPMSISKVIHKTFIDVNAEGTKAGASTAVIMTKNEDAVMPDVKYVTLDHPFLYMIYDRETALPVFIGTVGTLPQA